MLEYCGAETVTPDLDCRKHLIRMNVKSVNYIAHIASIFIIVPKEMDEEPNKRA